MIQITNTAPVVNGIPAANSNVQSKDGQAKPSNIKSVEVDNKTPKAANTDQSKIKKLSKGDYAIYVIWNTLRYASHLLAFPVIQISHSVFQAAIYGSRAVGFVSGLALGSLVGVGPALREIVRGNGCNQAFKKLSEYAVKGCNKGTYVGSWGGIFIGAPLFAISVIIVASAELSLLMGKPWLVGVLLGTCLAAAGVSASEVAHKGSSEINAKMNALVDKNCILPPLPKEKKQGDESKAKNAEDKPEDKPKDKPKEKIKDSNNRFEANFTEIQELCRR